MPSAKKLPFDLFLKLRFTNNLILYESHKKNYPGTAMGSGDMAFFPAAGKRSPTLICKKNRIPVQYNRECGAKAGVFRTAEEYKVCLLVISYLIFLLGVI